MLDLLEEHKRSSTLSPFPQSQAKEVGYKASSPLPPTFNVYNQVIFFPFCWKKMQYFSTFIRGNGGNVMQLKCPNYFWPGLLFPISCLNSLVQKFLYVIDNNYYV